MTLKTVSPSSRKYVCDVCGVEFILENSDKSLRDYGWQNLGWKHYCPEHVPYVQLDGNIKYSPFIISDTQPQDLINHPSHYTGHPSGVECVQITEHMDFLLGNVVKYVWRNGLKDQVPSLIDLRKAQWYLNRKIENLEKQP